MPLSLCPACRLPHSRALSTLPCEDCTDSLLFSPKICAVCLGFTCVENSCARPWMRVDGDRAAPTEFASLRAAYLSIGGGFRVLKSWKTTRNPALERSLLVGVRRALEPFAGEERITLIPVPQSARRRWELHGGSTLRLADMITVYRRERGFRTQTLDALVPVLSSTSGTSQAKQKGSERYRKETAFALSPRFLANPEIQSPPDPLILVDDFLTSGSTLRRALAALRPWLGTRPVHGFLLGFRPSLFAGD